jgi:phosphoribosyl-ATP pyrophosphohydrolase
MSHDAPAPDAPDTIHAVEAVLVDRKANRPEGSYSATLFADNELVQRKVMEEAFEVCMELGRSSVSADRVASEAADLVFHLLAGLVSVGVPWDSVLAELESRR